MRFLFFSFFFFPSGCLIGCFGFFFLPLSDEEGSLADKPEGSKSRSRKVIVEDVDDDWDWTSWGSQGQEEPVTLSDVFPENKEVIVISSSNESLAE